MPPSTARQRPSCCLKSAPPSRSTHRVAAGAAVPAISQEKEIKVG